MGYLLFQFSVVMSSLVVELCIGIVTNKVGDQYNVWNSSRDSLFVCVVIWDALSISSLAGHLTVINHRLVS